MHILNKNKRIKKMRQQENGVSAVIGVILMVAITVAIAGTVYYYVSHTFPRMTGPEFTGTITGTFNGLSYNGWGNCSIIINNIHYYYIWNGNTIDYYPLYGKNCTFHIELDTLKYITVNN